MRTMVLAYIYLHDWAMFKVNVGKNSGHGASGIDQFLDQYPIVDILTIVKIYAEPL